MTPIRIDIPNAKPADVRSAAGQIIMDAFREAGIDPHKAVCVQMARSLVGAWGRGEIDRAKFVFLCTKLGMLNPALKVDDPK